MNHHHHHHRHRHHHRSILGSCRTSCGGCLVSRLVRFVAIAILALASFHPSVVQQTNGLGLNNNNNNNINNNNIKFNINTVVNKAASKIPEKWKKDPTTGQPLACKAIEGTLRIATKVVLLGGGLRWGQSSSSSSSSSTSTSVIEIVVEAESNRAAFRGNLRRLSIAVRDSRSPLGLLEVERLDIEGSNLKLGWTPLITTVGIPLALILRPLRQTVWTVSIYYYLWTVVLQLLKRGATGEDITAVARVLEQTQTSVHRWKKRVLGGSPSQLKYEMVLSNDNLANSLLLRQSSKFLLRFLMKNSVLQTAAVVGDAVSDTQTATATATATSRLQQQRRNELQGSSSPGKLAKMVQQRTQQQRQPPNPFSNANTTPARENKLSRLLSATAFELREPPTFQNNHLQFVSVAILPDDQAQLEFVLRTTLEAGNRQSLLRFVQPECRFDVTEATSSLPLPKMVSDLLPKVLWLPIGSGVAIGGQPNDNNNGSGGASGLSIRDVQVLPEGNCKIRGTLSVGDAPPPPSRGGLVRR